MDISNNQQMTMYKKSRDIIRRNVRSDVIDIFMYSVNNNAFQITISESCSNSL